MGMPFKPTEETRAKSAETRRKSKEIIKEFGFPETMSKAIRKNCADCQGEGSRWVKNCTITNCALWAYRNGRPPKEKDLFVAEISREGEIVGHTHLRDMP